MACEHKHLKCVNCEFICAECGAKVDPPMVANAATEAKAAATDGFERPSDGFERPSGRKIGFDAEKPKRRTRKGATKE